MLLGTAGKKIDGVRKLQLEGVAEIRVKKKRPSGNVMVNVDVSHVDFVKF